VKPCIGLYGVVSYVAARKTNETSIRLALGATRVQVLGSVLKEGMLLVIAGMAISVPAMLAATRLITSLLFGVKAADPLTIGLATALMIAVAALPVFSSFMPCNISIRP
jgi:ABC-type antimicrobial peptide transport system permease subunit